MPVTSSIENDSEKKKIGVFNRTTEFSTTDYIWIAHYQIVRLCIKTILSPEVRYNLFEINVSILNAEEFYLLIFKEIYLVIRNQVWRCAVRTDTLSVSLAMRESFYKDVLPAPIHTI